MWGTFKRVIKGKVMWGSKININKKQVSGGFFEKRIDAHLRAIDLYEQKTGQKWKSKDEAKLNPDKLEEMLCYDEKTGIITWKAVENRRRKDLIEKRAGYDHHSGYRYITIGNKAYAEHRVAFYLYYGRWPRKQIDHINGIRNDNRIENLRDVEKYVNAQNQKEHRNGKLWGANNDKRSGKWLSRFTFDRCQYYCGKYNTEKEAHLIAKKKLETLKGANQ